MLGGILKTITASALALWRSTPLFPLYTAALIVFGIVLVIFYLVYTARSRAERGVAQLLADIDAITKKLSEAEKIGNFGSFMWDFDHPQETFWSEEMYHLCGLVPRRKPPGIDSILSVIHEKDREKAEEAWKKAQTIPGAFDFTFRVVWPTSEIRYLRFQGTTTVIQHDLKRIKGVAHDVTKEMEVDRSKTEFVSLASHQLKTPLTSVKWITEALTNGSVGTFTPEQNSYILQIREANQRMMDMVNDLLNVSRMELGKLVVRLEEVDTEELVKGVIAEQQHVADDKHISIQFVTEPGMPKIVADKGLFRMIFQNLLSNAIKYTPNQGLVTCEVSFGGLKHDSLAIKVTDTGMGIPKAEQPRIFEKLHRASNALAQVPDGTGLGLYMVKAIVDRAGGRISFESIEGKGTSFYVTMPLKWQVQEKTSQ